MKQPKETKEESLYPVEYNGKLYYEKDCDDVYTSFYHTRFALMFNSGVYVSDGVIVYPDGTMEDQ